MRTERAEFGVFFFALELLFTKVLSRLDILEFITVHLSSPK